MYGSRLTRDFGESVPEPWRSAINTLSDEQVRRGMRRLTAAGSASTPTLPQFVRACRTVGDDEGEARPAATFLPGPRYDPWHGFGQRALLRFLKCRDKQTSEHDLRRLIEVKNRIIAAVGADEQPEDVRDVLLAAFGKAVA